jgi:hypothetical protein
MNTNKRNYRLKLLDIITVLFFMNGIIHAQTIAPMARHLSQAIYDESNQQVLIYGGSTGGYTFTDLWSLTAAGWKKLSDKGPSDRIKSAFAYDVILKKAVLFGGSGANNVLLNDTWEWNGKAWEQNLATGPEARNHPMAVYDLTHKVIVMFGGIGSTGLLSDTWTFDGITWKLVDKEGPKDCLPHGMVYNEVTRKVMLLTLSVNRDPGDEAHAWNMLWEWTGNGWKKLSEATSVLTSSNLQALASFGKDELVLLDGSDVSNDACKTWTFSKDGWKSITLKEPTPRFGHCMVYDKSRGRTILFGGFSNGKLLNDLWEWDNVAWKKIGQ